MEERRGARAVSRLAGLMLLVGAFATLIAGCDFGDTSSAGNPAKDQTLKLVWSTGGGADITTLDPNQAQDTSAIPIVNLIFDGLVTLDKNLNVEAWGASTWALSSDGLTYTFTLRPNQRFSDGTPVKPSDYAWSMERSLSPCVGSPVSGYLAMLKDATAFNGAPCDNGAVGGNIPTLIGDSIIPDDSANTLTLKLEQPAGYFLQALTYSTSYALERSVVTGPDLGKDDIWLDNLTNGPTGQGGSGMFYVAAWDHQTHLRLKPNPYWWGVSAGKKPHFTAIEFTLFSSGDIAYAAYESDHSFAYSDGIPPEQIAAAHSQPDYHTAPLLAIGGLQFNWKVAPFDDVYARRAFCEAINRDQVNASILKGTTIPTWHIVPQGMPGYNASLHGIAHIPTSGDVKQAKADWARYLATHPGPIPPVRLSFNLASGATRLLVEAYQAIWNQLFAVNAQIDQASWKTILAQENAKTLQIYRFGWLMDYPDPQDVLTLLFATDSVYNNANVSIPAADRLMAQADALSDPQRRLALYAQAEQMLVDQVAFCPLFQAANYYRVRTWVKGGFVENAQGYFPNDAWVSGYIVSH